MNNYGIDNYLNNDDDSFDDTEDNTPSNESIDIDDYIASCMMW